MIPKLSVTKCKKGQLHQIVERTPIVGIEKDIVDALNSVFDYPNLTDYTKDSDKNFYFIIVHSDSKICKEDLRTLEKDSGCKVEIKNGMYGLAFFFTPCMKKKMNPSER